MIMLLYLLMAMSAVRIIIHFDGRKKSAAKKKKLTGRILAISDLHYIKDSEWNILSGYNYDAVIAVVMLGDISRTRAQSIRKIVPDNVPLLYVLGNHDRWNEYRGIANTYSLDGKAITVGGIKMTGLSGSTRYKPAPELAMRSQKEAKKITRQLPAADILVTHVSPYHMISDDEAHEGYKAIDHYISNYVPAYHIFGHHHISHAEKYGSTTCICVFRCAEIDLTTGKRRLLF